MRDPHISRTAKVIVTLLAVWALVAWIPGHGTGFSWHDTAKPATLEVEHSRSTQLILPESKEKYSSSQLSPRTWSKIAKVAMFSYIDSTTHEAITYENALRSHKSHNDRHGYLHYVLRRSLITVQYSKPAYVLTVILQELVKPPEERLEWLVWHDADLVLMNPEIPLEVFLPPPQFAHIHLVVTNDLGGLNSGVFFIRVNEWAVTYLTASISYRSWDPSFPTINEEQAIMDGILQKDPWKPHVMHVPQRWFNAYDDRGVDDDIPPEWNWFDQPFKPGRLLIHVPGTGANKTNLMIEWMRRKVEEPKEYIVTFPETDYAMEIANFWEKEAPREVESQETFWRRLKLIQKDKLASDRAREDAVEKVKSSMQGEEDGKIETAVRAKVKELEESRIERLRAAEKDLT